MCHSTIKCRRRNLIILETDLVLPRASEFVTNVRMIMKNCSFTMRCRIRWILAHLHLSGTFKKKKSLRFWIGVRRSYLLDYCVWPAEEWDFYDPHTRTIYNMHVKPLLLLEGLVFPYSDLEIKIPMEIFSQKIPLLNAIHYVNFSFAYLSSLISIITYTF